MDTCCWCTLSLYCPHLDDILWRLVFLNKENFCYDSWNYSTLQTLRQASGAVIYNPESYNFWAWQNVSSLNIDKCLWNDSNGIYSNFPLKWHYLSLRVKLSCFFGTDWNGPTTLTEPQTSVPCWLWTFGEIFPNLKGNFFQPGLCYPFFFCRWIKQLLMWLQCLCFAGNLILKSWRFQCWRALAELQATCPAQYWRHFNNCYKKMKTAQVEKSFPLKLCKIKWCFLCWSFSILTGRRRFIPLLSWAGSEPWQNDRESTDFTEYIT